MAASRAMRPKGAANEDRWLAVCGSIHHRHQVFERGKIFRLGMGSAEPASVISDGLLSGTEAVEFSAPHAPVAHAGMKEDDGSAAADDLGRQVSSTGCGVTY